MTNPYDELGVGREATPEEIRAAYRRKAHVLHPDKGGGVDRFQELQRAYDLLSDPERRQQYDRTGFTGRQNPRHIQLVTQLVGLMEQIIDQVPDPTSVDLRHIAEQSIRNSQNAVREKLRQLQTQLRKSQRMLGRFQHKHNGENLFENMLRSKVRNLEQRIAAMQQEVSDGDTLIQLVADYDYRWDNPQPPITMDVHGGTFTYTSTTTGR